MEHAFFSSPKEDQVRQIFNSIAPRYDYLNAVLSFSQHKYWSKALVQQISIPDYSTILDICCGTGQISMALAKKGRPNSKIIGIDFSEAMLSIARKNLNHISLKSHIQFIQGNAMNLPFPDNTFDSVTIAYGLRNVSDLAQVLHELYRVLKPGGKMAALELSQPEIPVFKQLYELYLRFWIPKLGELLIHNKAAYQYLYESIRLFPQPTQIAGIMHEQKFTKINFHPLTLGIAHIYTGRKTY